MDQQKTPQDNQPETPETQDTKIDSQSTTLDDSSALHTTSQSEPNISPGSVKPKKAGRLKKIKLNIINHWNKLSRTKKIIYSILALILVAGIGLGIYLLVHKTPQPVVAKTVTKTAPVIKPTTIASPLSGLQIAPDLAKRPVTGIMIENSTDARPQSGLQDAGVVYEAIAEGGITRFLALFQDTAPQYIGPVRSVRPYYIDFAQAYQASIVHVGGSPVALSTIRDGNHRDLDQFFNSGAFTRVSSRAAPHNVYTSFDNLDKLNQSKGYTTSAYTPWARKPDATLATPTATTINLGISSFYFNVQYNYDTATNSYLRNEGGVAHTNLTSAADKTGVQLHPKVVIAVVMGYSINADGQHSDYADTGSGNAYIFQDGGVAIGRWTKASADTMMTFTDTAGAPIKLNAGQTWISVVDSDSTVTYTAPTPPPATAQ